MQHDIKGELVEIFDVPALFIQQRIDKNALPDNIWAYDVRHDSVEGDPMSVEPHVAVNYYATVLTHQALDLGEDNSLMLGEILHDDYGLNFAGEEMTMENWTSLEPDEVQDLFYDR